jgi:hypothetical protein
MDALLIQLRRLRERVDRPVAQIASAFVATRAWRALGHARQEDYVRNRLQTTGRWLRQTAALGDALRRFPKLDGAFTGADGGPRLAKIAVLHIAGVATEETLPLWIARAREVSLRQLTADVKRAREDEVSGDGAVPAEGGESVEGEGAGGCASASDDEGAGSASMPTVDVVVICPPEVVAAFGETLDLHRAVCGSEATLTSFAEALVAEAGAGPEGPAEPTKRDSQDAWKDRLLRDPDGRPRRPPHPSWMDETDEETRAQRCRAEVCDETPPTRAVADLAADVFRLEAAAEAAATQCASQREDGSAWSPPDALELHDHLLAAGSLDLAVERAMARLLAALQRAQPWGSSGAACTSAPERDEGPTWAVNLAQYARERLGISASRARSLARVARRLGQFPILQEAWSRGIVSTDKVLILLPLLGNGPIDAKLEERWSEHAQHTTIRRLRDEVRELLRRSIPDRRRADAPPAPMPDDEWLSSLRRQPGRTVGRLERLGKHLDADPRPPRNVVRLALPHDLGLSLVAAINVASVREQTFSGEPSPPDRPPRTQTRPPAYWRGLMHLLLDYARTWDPPEDPKGTRPRHADIYERDGYRCACPDCTSRANLQAHHLRHRSQGGGDDPANLVTLCAYHHQRSIHETGTLEVRGSAPLGLRFTLGKDRHARTFESDRAVYCPQ